MRPGEPHHIVELFSEGPPASIECWGHAPDDIYWDDHPYFPWEPGMFSELVLLVKHFTTQRWNSWNWNSCPVIERMKAVMEEVRTLSYLPFDDLTKWHNICLAVSTLAPHIQYWCLFSISLPSHADPSRSNRRCFVVHHMIWNLVLMLPKVVMYAGSTTTFGVVRFCLEDVTNYLINYFAKLAPPKIFPSPVVPLHRSGRVNVWIAPCCPSRGAIHTAKSTTQIWPLQPITSFLINAPTWLHLYEHTQVVFPVSCFLFFNFPPQLPLCPSPIIPGQPYHTQVVALVVSFFFSYFFFHFSIANPPLFLLTPSSLHLDGHSQITSSDDTPFLVHSGFWSRTFLFYTGMHLSFISIPLFVVTAK